MVSVIRTSLIEDMIKITAGYVRESIQFEVINHDGMWVIKLSGGH